MNLQLRNILALTCFCMFGIQTGLSMIAEMRDVMNNCPREGGFCINTIPPQPPRKRNRNRNRNRNVRRQPGTRTRKGQRPKPSPRALGAQNNVLPGGRKPAAGVAAPGAAAPRRPQVAVMQRPQPMAPARQPPQQTHYDPFADLFNFGGSATSGAAAQGAGQGTGQGAGAGSSFDPFFGMMMFGTRKKRQAAAPPQFEPGEAPVRMPGQALYGFLNQHCLKSEFDFGCRSTGGFCCIPHP